MIVRPRLSHLALFGALFLSGAVQPSRAQPAYAAISAPIAPHDAATVVGAPPASASATGVSTPTSTASVTVTASVTATASVTPTGSSTANPAPSPLTMSNTPAQSPCTRQGYTNDPVQQANCNVAFATYNQDEANYRFATNLMGLGPHQSLIDRVLSFIGILPA